MRLIDADTLLMQLSNDLLYKSSVKRVLTMASTVDIAKKIFETITMRLNEAEYEMENFISNSNDTDDIADCRCRLDGLTYAMSIIDETHESFTTDIK